MRKMTLKDVTKKLGISLDEVVTYHKKGDKAVIEVNLKANGAQKPTKEKNQVLSNLLGMAEDVGIDDWSLNHDHYLYGTPKRKQSQGDG